MALVGHTTQLAPSLAVRGPNTNVTGELYLIIIGCELHLNNPIIAITNGISTMEKACLLNLATGLCTVSLVSHLSVDLTLCT